MHSQSSTSPQSAPEEKIKLWHDIKTQQFLKYAKDDLLAFTKYTKPDFYINWHHTLLCKKLSQFARGEIPRLMVFMPPRSGKSELVSRRLPAYLFGRNPNETIIAASYSDTLASMMNRDVQRIIDTPSYHQVFPEVTLNESNVRSNTRGSWLRNNDIFEIVGKRGRYRSAGVGSGITGLGGSTIIIDDPIKDQKEADSQTFRQNVWEWYTSTLYTRLENRNTQKGKILITLTRWHQDDLAGRLLELAKANPKADQWELISFPAVREDLDNPDDPRELGEALWPQAHDLNELEKIKSASTRVWNALYQQRPAPDKGAIFERSWWKFYGGPGQPRLPDDLSKSIQSWDLTFTEGKNTDFVVGAVWGIKGVNKYLLDRYRARTGFNGQIDAITVLSQKWPQAVGKYIEKAANGFAVHETLKNKISGIILVPPKGSKIVRAEAVTPQIQAGNVWIPDPSIAPWVNEFIEEHAEFPYGKNDDQVDTTSQALTVLGASLGVEAMPISISGPSKWTRY